MNEQNSRTLIVVSVIAIVVVTLASSGKVILNHVHNTADKVSDTTSTKTSNTSSGTICVDNGLHNCDMAASKSNSAAPAGTPTNTGTAQLPSNTDRSTAANTSTLPDNTICTNKALIAESLYLKSTKDADTLTDGYAAKVLANTGGNYTPDAIDAINDIYNNGNGLLNSAWQTYLKEIGGCPIDMSAPVLYTPIPKQ